MAISIYTYLDYRQYLTDVFLARNADDPSFSQRKFGRLAGSTSPNFLRQVQSRALNIKPASVIKIGKVLGLARSELDYFKAIVGFDHAENHEEKDSFFRKIMTKREYGCIKIINKNQYEFFSHWYIPIIRELVTHPAYPGNPLWIAKRIMPPVNVRKVKQGIELLSSLGLITRTTEDNAWWVQTNKVVSTPSELLSLAVTRYHRDAIMLGRDAIQRFRGTERDIRGVVMGLSQERYLEVKRRMEAFWNELLDFSGKDQHVDRVYQVNMQLFPVSQETARRRRP